MGGGCSTHVRNETWGNLKGRDHLQDLDVDGRIIICEIGWEGKLWTDSAGSG